jgi:hypothetical protein
MCHVTGNCYCTDPSVIVMQNTTPKSSDLFSTPTKPSSVSMPSTPHKDIGEANAHIDWLQEKVAQLTNGSTAMQDYIFGGPSRRTEKPPSSMVLEKNPTRKDFSIWAANLKDWCQQYNVEPVQILSKTLTGENLQTANLIVKNKKDLSFGAFLDAMEQKMFGPQTMNEKTEEMQNITWDGRANTEKFFQDLELAMNNLGGLSTLQRSAALVQACRNASCYNTILQNFNELQFEGKTPEDIYVKLQQKIRSAKFAKPETQKLVNFSEALETATREARKEEEFQEMKQKLEKLERKSREKEEEENNYVNNIESFERTARTNYNNNNNRGQYPQRRQQPPPRYVPFCSNCNREGHRTSECRRGPTICYNCGKPGHKQAECRNLKRKGREWEDGVGFM